MRNRFDKSINCKKKVGHDKRITAGKRCNAYDMRQEKKNDAVFEEIDLLYHEQPVSNQRQHETGQGFTDGSDTCQKMNGPFQWS